MCKADLVAVSRCGLSVPDHYVLGCIMNKLWILLTAVTVIALVLTTVPALGQVTAGTSLPGKNQKKPLPVIDMHMHARVKLNFSPDGKPLPRPCDPQPCRAPAAVYTTDDAIRLGTLAAMDKYNVVKAFLSDEPDGVRKWVESAPGRFVASVAWDSEFPDIDWLRKEYRTGRLKGLGEIGTQYATIAPNDPRLEPYYSLAEELDLPVLIHTAGLGAHTPGFRASLGHPLLLEEVLVRHPRLRLYVENAGYPFLDEMVALMTQYPQVYADVSTITWIIPRSAFHRYLKGLIDAGLGKRVMMGSDQMEWPETVGLAIAAINSADYLTTEQKRDLLCRNAARFLRLEEKVCQ